MNRDLDFNLLFKIFIKNFKYILFFSFILSILPFYSIYQSYNNPNITIKYNVDVTPSSKLEIRTINNILNEIYSNSFLKEIQAKQEFFYYYNATSQTSVIDEKNRKLIKSGF